MEAQALCGRIQSLFTGTSRTRIKPSVTARFMCSIGPSRLRTRAVFDQWQSANGIFCLEQNEPRCCKHGIGTQPPPLGFNTVLIVSEEGGQKTGIHENHGFPRLIWMRCATAPVVGSPFQNSFTSLQSAAMRRLRSVSDISRAPGALLGVLEPFVMRTLCPLTAGSARLKAEGVLVTGGRDKCLEGHEVAGAESLQHVSPRNEPHRLGMKERSRPRKTVSWV